MAGGSEVRGRLSGADWTSRGGQDCLLPGSLPGAGAGSQEWINPVEQVNFHAGELLYEEETRDYKDTVEFVSKAKQFKQWLRGARYSSFTGRKVILIEDLPSQKNPEELHDVVEWLSQAGLPS